MSEEQQPNLSKLEVVTCCGGCVFAEYKDHEQTGCKLNRREPLGWEGDWAEKDGDKHSVFYRFCNTYRPQDWVDELNYAEKLDLEYTVMTEVYPNLMFIVLFDADSEEDQRIFEQQLDAIENQDLYFTRRIIVVNQKFEYNDYIIEELDKRFGDSKFVSHHTVLYQHDVRQEWLIDQAVQHNINGWAYVVANKQIPPTNVISRIHEITNVECVPLLVSKPNDGMNGLVFQAALYKYLKGSMPTVDPDTLEADRRMFLERVADWPLENKEAIREEL